MRKSNLSPLILGSVGMLVVIFDGKTAVAGIREGVQLCLNTLIPSLFPFFVLSSLVTASLAGHSMGPLGALCKFCRMCSGTESFLIVGILGGYPVGAANIAAAHSKGKLTTAEAERMAVFCNNAGPSFLFGVLGSMFPSPKWVWLLWGIQISASILTGFLLPGGSSGTAAPCESQQMTLTDSLYRGVKSMSLVCGWVIMFRMILEFLRRWILWCLPVPGQILITGLLELSNGCLALTGIKNVSLRFLIAGFLLSMGGLCVWMQTSAVFPKLNLAQYIGGRILHASIGFFLSLPVLAMMTETSLGLPMLSAISFGIGGFFLLMVLRKQKKAVAFSGSMMYNG